MTVTAPASVAGSIEHAEREASEPGAVSMIPTIPTAEEALESAPSTGESSPMEAERPAEGEDEPATRRGVLPPPEPGPPRLRLLPSVRSGCDHEVEAKGWPAIRDDGSQFAFVLHPVSAVADYEDQPFSVETHTVADDEVASVEVFDGETIYSATDGKWGKACRAEREKIAARVEVINASFATGWRPLVRVPVQWPWHVSAGATLPELPADRRARPVEVLFHGGHFIARVRGMKVLQSTPMPWRGEEPEMTLGASDPAILTLYHDAATGFAVVELSYESASCMSDPTVYTRTIALLPEVVTEARARAEFLLPDPDDL